MLKGWFFFFFFFACYPSSCDFEIQLCFSHKKKCVATLRPFYMDQLAALVWHAFYHYLFIEEHRYDYK